MPVLSSLLHASNFTNPFLRTLIPSITLAYALQGLVAIPSILLQSERFYDASGSLTYLACTALSLYLPTIRARHAARLGGSPALPGWPSLMGSLGARVPAGTNLWNWRQVVLSAAVGIWAGRCTFLRIPSSRDGVSDRSVVGTYLFRRITSEGGTDSRFESIRTSPAKFGAAFFAQATWVSLCLLPVLAINSLPSTGALSLAGLSLGVTDVVGLLLYVGGLTFESVADSQKSTWSAEKRRRSTRKSF